MARRADVWEFSAPAYYDFCGADVRPEDDGYFSARRRARAGRPAASPARAPTSSASNRPPPPAQTPRS